MRMMTALATGAFALSTLLPAEAAAHGREPSVGEIVFDPNDPEHIVMRTTWALLTSRDDGRSFTWTCAVAVGFDRLTEDPPVLITPTGGLMVGTFGGLRLSDGAGCGYADGPPSTRDAFAIDVQRDRTGAVWVAMSPGDAPNTFQRSTDSGVTFTTVGAAPLGVLIDKMRIAPSDPSRIYASGVFTRTATTPRRGAFLYSEDGGATFETTEIPFLSEEERNVHVLAVDPTDPARVLVRIVRRVTDVEPERLLLTDNGGRSFRTVLMLREMTGVIFSHDGRYAWAGSWDGGFYRSDDGGRSFFAVDEELGVRCLAERAADDGTSDLFVCVDEFTEPYAVARSFDLGENLERVWGFSDAVNDVGCSVCTDVGAECPAYWPDVVFDLALTRDDAGMPPGPVDVGPRASCDEAGVPLDAGASAPLPLPRGCACTVAAPRSGWLPSALALGMLGLVLGRRKKLGQHPKKRDAA